MGMSDPFLNDLWWRASPRIRHKKPKPLQPIPPLPELIEHNREMGEEFRTLCENRLLFGAYRYGLTGDPNKLKYDRVEYIGRILKNYEETGNLECLVDIANLAELEYIEGDHPCEHFTIQERERDHGEGQGCK